MRICLISREYPPETGWGGVGAYTFQTANSLKQLGHEVDVISLAALDDSEYEFKELHVTENGISVHRVPWEKQMEELNLMLLSIPASHYIMKSGIAIWKKFLELHTDNPFDIVEAPEHLGAGFFHAITRVCPLVVTLHTPHSKFVAENFHSVNRSFDNRLICILERLAIGAADLILSPSEDMASFVSKDAGIPLEKISIVRNPVDTRTFNPEGEHAIREGSSIKVLFVGRLEERKGIQHLIEAIPRVVEEIENVEFIVIGNDTNTAKAGGSMKRFLEKRLAKLGCLDKVKFYSHVPLSEMPSYYRSADLCVVPSMYDNAPYTCIEPLATGKPVIASSFGGTKEYIQEGKTGLVIPGADTDALAEAIVRLCKDEKLRAAMGYAAREYAVSMLDNSIYSIRKIELYEKAINQFQLPHKPMYSFQAEKSLEDSMELLGSFDQMILSVLCDQSLEFRLRHWFRLLRKRPRLAVGSALVSLLETTSRLPGARDMRMKAIEKLKHSMSLKSPPPYQLAREWASLPNAVDEANLQNSAVRHSFEQSNQLVL